MQNHKQKPFIWAATNCIITKEVLSRRNLEKEPFIKVEFKSKNNRIKTLQQKSSKAVTFWKLKSLLKHCDLNQASPFSEINKIVHRGTQNVRGDYINFLSVNLSVF